MAWNEPGGNKDQDPWGRKKKGNNEPPDLDEAFKKFAQKLGGIFGGGGRSSQSSGWGLLFAIFLIAAVVWAGFGFKQVGEREIGVVLRFGAMDREVTKGLNWIAPGIEEIRLVDTNNIETHRVEDTMLTGDKRIVSVELVVQYRRTDAKKYLFNAVGPEQTLSQATESALRFVIGLAQTDDVLSDDKKPIQEKIKLELEQLMQTYDVGLSLVNVVLQKTDVPPKVQPAVVDVSKAKEDKKVYVNEANGHRNKVIPLAEAEAKKVLVDADAYRQRKINEAKGEVARFEQLLPQYEAAPEVTRKRLYLEAMEEVMSNVTKVFVDDGDSNQMLYLPLDQILKQRQNESSSNQSQGSN